MVDEFEFEKGLIIGSDECLKGDTFGGIVVAAVKGDDKIRRKLFELGVTDSKKITDSRIIPLAEEIKQVAPYRIKNMLPEEYNQLIRKSFNITFILNKLHHECADGLKPGVHIVDLYPGCNVGDVQKIRAESKYLEVAAASILARAAALEQLNSLSQMAGFEVPKGSTHVADALEKLQKSGANFKQFVKVDFRNVKPYLQMDY